MVLEVYGYVCFWRDSPQWARVSSFTRFLDHTQRRVTVLRTVTRRGRLWTVNHCGRVISSLQRPLSDNTQHSLQTNVHFSGGIRTHNICKRAAADLRLRPRGHWDRLRIKFAFPKSNSHYAKKYFSQRLDTNGTREYTYFSEKYFVINLYYVAFLYGTGGPN
jgi:hypothetical protein